MSKISKHLDREKKLMKLLFIHVCYLGPYLPKKKDKSPFLVLFFTLMRLRLNVSTKSMAYIFNMSYSAVSVLVRRVVKVMYVRLKPFVKWPDRTVLQKSMPMQFRRHFGTKCAVIIDCFEVFIER